MPIFAGTFDGGAIAWTARLAGLGAESTGRDGSPRLKHWCQAPQGRAANLVVSALRESSMIWIHRNDLCGLQRRESPRSLVLRLNQNTGPGVLSARDSLQPWKAESKHCSMSEIGRVIMILMHVNTVIPRLIRSTWCLLKRLFIRNISVLDAKWWRGQFTASVPVPCSVRVPVF